MLLSKGAKRVLLRSQNDFEGFTILLWLNFVDLGHGSVHRF